jgi:hypothetical protein
MSRIYALWSVAFMTDADPFWDFSIERLKRETMGVWFAESTRIPISSPHPGFRPDPTTTINDPN